MSFSLKKHHGYKIGTRNGHNISHLFLADDLQLVAQNIEKAKKMLGTVAMFSKDIGMTFGESKCAYQCIERGKKKLPLLVNNLTLKEIDEGDQYRYLGIDESVGILGPLNKERGIKE